jgi:3-isopropylmalate/(R)-2-methylmalate dehydratase small subunit
MILNGKVWKFGNDIDTDIIVPGRYLELAPDEYKKHIMEPVRPDFYSMIQKGDFIFAGKGFGMGSSRGHAVVGLLEAGIKAIVAHSFARIFYRSAINEGLPVIECPEASDRTNEGDLVQIDISSGEIKNETQGTSFHFHPYPEFVQKIVLAGGGVNYFKNQLKEREK